MESSSSTIVAGHSLKFKNGKNIQHLIVLWIVAAFMAMMLLMVTGCGDTSSQGMETDQASDNDVSALATEVSWASHYFSRFFLYPGEIPGSISYEIEETTTGAEDTLRYYNVSVPTLSAFLPREDVATGAAVVICPGGGYGSVNYGSVVSVAEAMAENGIAAFILKYRLPNDLIMADKSIAPLQDAQEAVKMVRMRASEWNIDPSRVGVMGQSAGGHVAASAGVHYDDVYIDNEEGIDLRPAFMILVSAVISMDEEITHAGSRSNLLGEDPGTDLVGYFSSELQVTEDTPPAWIAHAEDDATVMVENSELFFDALDENGVPAELNRYATGGHSFVIDIAANGWFYSLLDWLDSTGIITPQ